MVHTNLVHTKVDEEYHVVVSGSIGAGKTTLVDKIKHPNVYKEPWGKGKDCKELKNFSDDPKGNDEETNTVIFQNLINEFYIDLKNKQKRDHKKYITERGLLIRLRYSYLYKKEKITYPNRIIMISWIIYLII